MLSMLPTNASFSAEGSHTWSRGPIIFRRFHRLQQMVRTSNIWIWLRWIIFLGFWARCLAIDLFMSCSSKGVSRYHLTANDGLLVSLPGTGMCTFTNVCQNMTTLCVLGYIFCLETKNTWARDDPAILVLIGACLCGMLHVLSLSIYIEIYWISSFCYCLGCCLLVQCSGDTESRTFHDFSRFPCVWGCNCHSAMVIIHKFSHVYQLTIA